MSANALNVIIQSQHSIYDKFLNRRERTDRGNHYRGPERGPGDFGGNGRGGFRGGMRGGGYRQHEHGGGSRHQHFRGPKGGSNERWGPREDPPLVDRISNRNWRRYRRGSNRGVAAEHDNSETSAIEQQLATMLTGLFPGIDAPPGDQEVRNDEPEQPEAGPSGTSQEEMVIDEVAATGWGDNFDGEEF